MRRQSSGASDFHALCRVACDLSASSGREQQVASETHRQTHIDGPFWATLSRNSSNLMVHIVHEGLTATCTIWGLVDDMVKRMRE